MKQMSIVCLVVSVPFLIVMGCSTSRTNLSVPMASIETNEPNINPADAPMPFLSTELKSETMQEPLAIVQPPKTNSQIFALQYPSDETNYMWYEQHSLDMIIWTDISGPYQGVVGTNVLSFITTNNHEFFRMRGIHI